MKKISEIVSNITDIPPSVFPDVPFIEINGRSHIELEGVRKILEYTSNCLRLKFGSSTVRFEGENLAIVYFGRDNTIIEGSLKLVEFE